MYKERYISMYIHLGILVYIYTDKCIYLLIYTETQDRVPEAGGDAI